VKRATKLLGLALVISIIVPPLIGAILVAFVPTDSEEPSRAQSYYNRLIDGSSDLSARRNEYALVSVSPFGHASAGALSTDPTLNVDVGSLSEEDFESLSDIEGALRRARSDRLLVEIDNAGSAAMDELGPSALGGLIGCDYTIIRTQCRWFARGKAVRRITEQRDMLAERQREVIRRFDVAMERALLSFR